MSRDPKPRESPATLRIRFQDGERPHVFWVSGWTKPPEPPARYKILSKRRPNGSIEVIVIEESEERGRQCLAREDIPADAPAGWLSRWVSELASSVGITFERFDLTSIETEAEWREAAERLGWTPEPREERAKSL